jgi:hypothetical protein
MIKTGRGGKRPGAGRPKGTVNASTINKEQAREALARVVMAHMEDLVGAQIANAKGLKYLVIRNAKTGKFERVTEERIKKLLDDGDDELERVEVWEKDPSVQAFTDLMNRALDKPKEQEQEIRISGEVEIVAVKLQEARKRLAARNDDSQNP